MGAAFETTWRIEAAQVLAPGGGMELGGYHLTLQGVNEAPGANFDAEQAVIRVTDGRGALACAARPARKTYDTGGQTTSKVAICPQGLDDLYIVLGERRTSVAGASAWLVRGYFNPWARLLFLGPLFMALGGALSLSDRRLRFGVAKIPSRDSRQTAVARPAT
jgi:cytochrome c-type biogenesis protein CcmF